MRQISQVSSNEIGASTLQVLVRQAQVRVEFEPAARTAWHTHSGPQILIVINGCCRLQRHGKPLTEIIAGDVVCIEPRERHWHGAAPDSPMTHIAINIDSTTTWLEKVTDTEYVGAFR